ncbi:MULTISPECIES: SLAP domain-containing protein [unclassified Lactobacillus]|uniref:SLAP domain-containing protein n=1 Tax=unclassified Lactobacillus TaxID=2620435 RepID=UPI000EFB8A4F|nr:MULTISPECIES: SLAP domain-containing protein [unclassified Lactobacillus]RMC24394.1 hypothetical protein F5ESL0247_04270 [Lactobacillus sp. ESL0247]RMC28533.1 hypothetical protein F5ESL0246_04270 [Lactobacillus sp. ESL0246]RMC31724.1 hypothetical protein F5ESL0245_04275 [Lactobacillus sp. ESL0245]
MTKKILLSIIGATLLNLVMVTPVLATETNALTTDQNIAKSQTTDTNQPNGNQNETGKKPTENNANALTLINRYVKVTKNSVIYNQDFKKIKNKKLKKGTVVYINGFNNRKSENYLRFITNAKNKKKQYILATNVVPFKAVSYKVKRNARIYSSKGVINQKYYIPKGRKVIVLATKEIKKTKFVAISETRYLKWTDLDAKSAQIIAQ